MGMKARIDLDDVPDIKGKMFKEKIEREKKILYLIDNLNQDEIESLIIIAKERCKERKFIKEYLEGEINEKM